MGSDELSHLFAPQHPTHRQVSLEPSDGEALRSQGSRMATDLTLLFSMQHWPISVDERNTYGSWGTLRAWATRCSEPTRGGGAAPTGRTSG